MSMFINDEAQECGYRSEELLSDHDSDLSDVIPLQELEKDSQKRARRRLPLSDSSESEDEQLTRKRARGKENREPNLENTDRSKRKKSECNTPSSGPNESHILSELKKTNKLIMSLSKKMKTQEIRLKEIEMKLSDSSMNSSSCATPKRTAKKEVPCEVRRETRRVYNLLLEDSETEFQGWKIQPGKTFKDSDNQSVLNILIQEVKGLNPTFLTQHIRDAAYRFYRSRTEELSSKRRGTFDMKSKSKRRHERLVRKLQERKRMCEAGSYKDDAEKEKWQSIVTMDFMSSDESCTEDGSDVLVSKPLSWESASVTGFKKTLDDAALDKKSSLAKRQMKPRRKGMPSARPKPAGDYPNWAFEE